MPGHAIAVVRELKSSLWDTAGGKELHIRPQNDCSQAKVKEILRTIGLVEKTNALSSSLSGGMKRKLSLSIALIGGKLGC